MPNFSQKIEKKRCHPPTPPPPTTPKKAKLKIALSKGQYPHKDF